MTAMPFVNYLHPDPVSSGFTPPVFNDPYQTRQTPVINYTIVPVMTSDQQTSSITSGGPRPVRPSEFVDPDMSIEGWSAPYQVYTTPSAGMMISSGTHIGIAASESTVTSTSSNYLIPAMLMPNSWEGSGSVRNTGYSGWPGIGSASIYTRYPTQTNYIITTTPSLSSEK